MDFGEKAKYFNEFFSKQCKPIINNSILPNLTFLTGNRINHIAIGNGEILSLIRNLNPNKATGSDGISGQMLLLCEDSVILPLEIIFETYLQPLYTPTHGNLPM